jgi:hypothetical protein
MTGMLKYLALAALLAAAGGCGDLAYVHSASLGVDVTVSTEGVEKLSLGYENDTYTIVPKSGSGDTTEAMTLVSVSNVNVDGLDEVIFNHVFATGAAAMNAANDPTELAALRQAVLGITTSTTAATTTPSK